MWPDHQSQASYGVFPFNLMRSDPEAYQNLTSSYRRCRRLICISSNGCTAGSPVPRLWFRKSKQTRAKNGLSLCYGSGARETVRDDSYLTTNDSPVNTEPYMKSEGDTVRDESCSARIGARRPSELVPCCWKQLWLDQLLPVYSRFT